MLVTTCANRALLQIAHHCVRTTPTGLWTAAPTWGRCTCLHAQQAASTFIDVIAYVQLNSQEATVSQKPKMA